MITLAATTGVRFGELYAVSKVLNLTLKDSLSFQKSEEDIKERYIPLNNLKSV